MQKLLRLHGGSTAHAPFTDGEMLGQSKSQRLDGLRHFLFLNLIGRYAWQVDFQQVLKMLPSSLLLEKLLKLSLMISWLSTALIKMHLLLFAATIRHKDALDLQKLLSFKIREYDDEIFMYFWQQFILSNKEYRPSVSY